MNRNGEAIHRARPRDTGQTEIYIDWTRKVMEGLQYTIEQMETLSEEDPERSERITYEEWRDWQETLAKQYGFSETTDTRLAMRGETRAG